MASRFVPETEVQRAIVDGRSDRIVAYFSRTPRSEWPAQRPSVARALKVMDAARWTANEAKRQAWGGNVTENQLHAASTAVMFCGTAEDIAKHVYEFDELVQIGLAHRPPGFDGLGDAILERSLMLISPVQDLIAAGLIERPTSTNYVIALLGLTGRTGRGKSFDDYWKADPGLKDVLLRVMEVEGTSEMNLAAVDKYCKRDATWSRLLLDLAAKGVYPRALLLEKTLTTLASDWPQFRAGWFSRFHEELAPTLDEMQPHRARYLALAHSRIPPTVTLSLEVLTKLDAQKPFSTAEWTEALRPVMSSAVKAQVLTALKLMDRIVERDSVTGSSLANIAMVGLAHPALDVQKAVVERLAAWGLTAEQRALAAGYASGVAAVVQPKLRALLGEHNVVQRPLQPTPAAASAATESLRTDPLACARRINEIADIDELIDRLAYVLENSGDAEEFERVLAALVRLGPISAEQQPRFGALLKRGAKIVHPLPRELVRVLQLLTTGIRVSKGPWRDDNRGTTSRAEAFLIARVDALMSLAASGHALTPLATPTHRRGFIDPLVFVHRLAEHARVDLPPSELESVQALLRLAPSGRADALAASRSLPDWPVVRALRYALGDAAKPAGHKALFAAAERIRDARADEFEWKIKTHESGKYTFRNLFVHARRGPATADVEYLTTARQPNIRTLNDWYQLKSYFAGPGPGMVALAALAQPNDMEAFFAEAVLVIGNNLDWWEAQWWSHEFLRPLLDSTTPLAPMACLLLALGLCTKEPGQAALAVDAFAHSMHRDADTGTRVGNLHAELLSQRFILASRLAARLRTVLQIDPSLASTVFDTLAAATRAMPTEPIKDFAKLLELLQELQLTTGKALPAETRTALQAMQLGGQGAKIRKALLSQH